jgi:hypothetical protein
MDKNKVRAIAFYLPQFYPTPENDEWWGPGFTEWTNVASAKPLFKGHYQPRIPRDLGFYDLRVPEVRERQVQMARDAGIEGFCYWHYWFAGRRLLDRVFTEVVETGKPDFPFCLCWANHSWQAKTWKPNEPNKILIEQTYPGVQDYIDHFYAMLPAFKDRRYMKVDGRLIYGIFAPRDFPDFKSFSNIWNKLAKENGLDGFFFFALTQGEEKLEKNMFDASLYDAIVLDKMIDTFLRYDKSYLSLKYHNLLVNKLKRPYVIKYDKYVSDSLRCFYLNPSFIPCIDPDFDHTPRSAHRWMIFKGSTPDKWRHFCEKTVKLISRKEVVHNIIFIKSWNEWGEGNYLEPDMKNGKAYLDATKQAFVKS